MSRQPDEHDDEHDDEHLLADFKTPTALIEATASSSKAFTPCRVNGEWVTALTWLGALVENTGVCDADTLAASARAFSSAIRAKVLRPIPASSLQTMAGGMNADTVSTFPKQLLVGIVNDFTVLDVDVDLDGDRVSAYHRVLLECARHDFDNDDGAAVHFVSAVGSMSEEYTSTASPSPSPRALMREHIQNAIVVIDTRPYSSTLRKVLWTDPRFQAFAVRTWVLTAPMPGAVFGRPDLFALVMALSVVAEDKDAPVRNTLQFHRLLVRAWCFLWMSSSRLEDVVCLEKMFAYPKLEGWFNYMFGFWSDSQYSFAEIKKRTGGSLFPDIQRWLLWHILKHFNRELHRAVERVVKCQSDGGEWFIQTKAEVVRPFRDRGSFKWTADVSDRVFGHVFIDTATSVIAMAPKSPLDDTYEFKEALLEAVQERKLWSCA